MTKELLMKAQCIQNEIKAISISLDSVNNAVEVKVQINTRAGTSLICLTPEQQKYLIEYFSCECKKRLSALEDEFSKL